MPTEPTGLNLDLVSPRFKANPYPMYARLRAESPIAVTRLPDGRQAWLIARYEDVARGVERVPLRVRTRAWVGLG